MEEKKVWQGAGGKATAIKERKEAIEKYYNNPNRCLFCSKVIIVKERERVCEVRKKKFCDCKCSAIYNNKLKPKKDISGSTCNKCGKYFEYQNKSYYKKKLCDECRKKPSNTVIGDGKSNCSKCGKEVEHTKLKFFGNVYHKRKFCDECIEKIDNKTKGEYFANKKYWQLARSKITKHAKKIFNLNNGSKKCFVCGYDKYVEVCHKKPVAKFEDSATIKEINDINNLVALCPNHHKELDLGLLKLELAGPFGTHEPDL